MRHASRHAVVVLASLIAFGTGPGTPHASLAAVSGRAAYQAAARSLLDEGRASLAAGDAKKALRAFETALVADPGSVAAMVAIGKAHEAMGQRALGLSYYRRALTIDPANRQALAAEALAFLAADRLEEAEKNVARLERLCAAKGCPELARVRAAIEAYKAKSMAAATPGKEGTL